MIFDRKGTTTIITQESVSIMVFLEKLSKEYKSFENDNIIVNLFSLNNITVSDLLEFSEISNMHKEKKKSFVIITDKLNYNDIPTEITVVPTLKEAFDLIEMEEIERDLGF